MFLIETRTPILVSTSCEFQKFSEIHKFSVVSVQQSVGQRSWRKFKSIINFFLYLHLTLIFSLFLVFADIGTTCELENVYKIFIYLANKLKGISATEKINDLSSLDHRIYAHHLYELRARLEVEAARNCFRTGKKVVIWLAVKNDFYLHVEIQLFSSTKFKTPPSFPKCNFLHS